MNNEVIIIGGNHHNMLGVIRTFGEIGIRTNVIITNENKYAFVKKSRYIKNYSVVKEGEYNILKELQKYKGFDAKPVIIPTSDFAEYVVDKNLDDLSEFFVVPNIDNKKNEIIKLMNKYNQSELFKKHNVRAPKTEILDLNNISRIEFPFILKPINSIDGTKNDIKICKNDIEFNSAIDYLKEKKYSKVLMQEFLANAEEIDLIGYCFGEDVFIPGVIEKIRVFPPKRGTISYGKVEILNKNINILNIINMLKSLNYFGMIDIDLFKIDGEYYVNEINFRNSGNSYIYSSQKIPLVYYWYKLAIGEKINVNKLNKEFYFMDEFLEKQQFIKGNISIKEFLKSKKKSSCYFIKNKKDKAPQRWKKIYAILRRIDKNGFK